MEKSLHVPDGTDTNAPPGVAESLQDSHVELQSSIKGKLPEDVPDNHHRNVIPQSSRNNDLNSRTSGNTAPPLSLDLSVSSHGIDSTLKH